VYHGAGARSRGLPFGQPTYDLGVISPDISSDGRDERGRWTSGTSGNPDGRPIGRGSITVELRRLLAETDADGVAVHTRIAERLIHMAKQGDLKAIREVLDRVDGLSSWDCRESPDGKIELGKIELMPITFERRD
jgi:hypothetical protein